MVSNRPRKCRYSIPFRTVPLPALKWIWMTTTVRTKSIERDGENDDCADDVLRHKQHTAKDKLWCHRSNDACRSIFLTVLTDHATDSDPLAPPINFQWHTAPTKQIHMIDWLIDRLIEIASNVWKVNVMTLTEYSQKRKYCITYTPLVAVLWKRSAKFVINT